MNFIGRYYHALEQKGRIAIPKNFRQHLGETSVVTRGLDGCIFLFPQENWKKTIENVSIHSFTSKSIREWTRLLIHHAKQCDFDSQGRILIPEHLISHAGLNTECVVAGSIEYIEIWDKVKYHTYLDELEGRAEEIAEAVSQKEKQ